MNNNKLYIILFYFFIGKAFCLTNLEINNAIKGYFKQNGVEQNFTLNKKIRLPDCKKKIDIKKKFDSFKTLEIICPQDHPWTYNIRIRINNKESECRYIPE